MYYEQIKTVGRLYQKRIVMQKKIEVTISITKKNNKEIEEIIVFEKHPTLTIEELVYKRLRWRIDIAEYNIKNIKNLEQQCQK